MREGVHDDCRHISLAGGSSDSVDTNDLREEFAHPMEYPVLGHTSKSAVAVPLLDQIQDARGGEDEEGTS